ncbi:hypothetical protein GCM10012275_62870 [Longimycelium tulufanense]|uniref:MmcQ/YjbR family DNA-binding protein n=1 Tax=Longimycelium tulufanense TaxID=907463 RepID=A0A8J3CEY7_9PSEU|nr:MmcQ/YjbR family DNA-binding protein [Longimycelium tulufanense]GGM83677.1 hypothetical protein GCM10012275_62870 [Longimycelium tulufanense]
MPRDIAGDLARLALSLPETQQRETWGEQTFRVQDKIFLTLSPDGALASLRTTMEQQTELIAMDPTSFSVAPYTGRFGWVLVHLATVDPDLVGEFVVAAWRRTAPRRVVASYERATVDGEDTGRVGRRRSL